MISVDPVKPAPLTSVLLLALILSVLGCRTPTPPEPLPPAAESAWTDTEMVRVKTAGRGLLLVRPDHQLGRYDDLLIERIGFRYGDDQEWLSFREEDRVSAILTSAVQGSSDGGIGIVNEAGPCVLGVRFYLTDLKLYQPNLPTGAHTSYVRSFGEGTLIMELRDSMSEQPLARFIQRRELGGGTASIGNGESIRRLETVVGLAMRDMGRQIRRLTPPTTGPWEGRCHGGMTRVAFGSR